MASQSSQHVGRHSSLVSYHKGSHHGFFYMPGAQGSAIAAFNPLLVRDMHCTGKGPALQSCHTMVGATQASTSNLPAMLEKWAGWNAQEDVQIMP